MAKRIVVSKAGRVLPGDRIVTEGAALFVSRVVKARGRKPPRGENLEIIAFDAVNARRTQTVKVNSLDTVKIMARPLTNA